MLRDRLHSNVFICRTEFSLVFAVLAGVAALLMWSIPQPYPGDGVRIYIPRTLNAVDLWGARRDDALNIAIQRDGQIFFQQWKVGADELPNMLRESVRSGSPRKVYIRVDRRSRYRATMLVLDGIQAAGLSEIAFIARSGGAVY
jgi:biopolymer transport protein ExbD